MSLAALFTRRITLVASRQARVLPRTFLRATLATQTNNTDKTINLPDHEKEHPTDENPEGPMMDGYQETLDDMISKTEHMEASMEALKTTYDKKKEAVLTSQTVKWMDPEEIEGLFDLAGRQKREMEQQLQELKKTLQAAKSNYAVDAPWGESDGEIEREMEEINHIIDEAAEKRSA